MVVVSSVVVGWRMFEPGGKGWRMEDRGKIDGGVFAATFGACLSALAQPREVVSSSLTQAKAPPFTSRLQASVSPVTSPYM
jgi:hypothetical protein